MYSLPSIQQHLNGLNDGATTCVATVETCLERIQAEKHLNAFVDIYPEEALERALMLDNKRASGAPLGRLHGVIVGIKDVICYKGHRVSASSAILEGFVSTYNATVVEKLLAEDAIIIGNLNCDEFAMGSSNENSAFGPVLNGLDNSRVPGGSSGGSAVAVQAGLCMVSLGSDTGGSVRQPADFCGIIGLKPTYGRISRYGLIAYASSFDQIGIFGTSLDDVALVLEIIAGADEFDSTVSDRPVEAYTNLETSKTTSRIAYFREAFEHASLDPEMASAFQQYLEKLRSAGHELVPVDFDELDYIVPAYYVLTTAEASSNLSRFDGVRYGHSIAEASDLTEYYSASRSTGFGREVKRRIMLGTFVLSTGYYDAYFTRAQQVRQKLVNKSDLIFKEFDALILPTVPSPAFRFGEKSDDPIEMYLADIYTVFANLTGLPAISIPMFTHPNGMPFGLQIMSSRFSELSLLRLSHQLMQQ